MQIVRAKYTRISWLLGSLFIFSTALLYRSQNSSYDARDPYLVAADESEGRATEGSFPRFLGFRRDEFESASNVGKNHDLVHEAFEEIVSKINASTVRIMSGERQVSLGTVVGADGYILTKATELPEKIECRVPGNIVRQGKVVAVDHEYDLALLKIDASGLKPAKIDNIGAPSVGGWVATPSGFTAEPVAIGVVSVPLRNIRSEQAVLGIELEDTPEGPRIRRVMENSGAANAGLEMGDMVLKIDGQAIANFAGLQRAVRDHRPGEKLPVEFKRGDETISKTVQLTQRSEVMPDDEAIQNAIGGRLSRRRAGFSAALQHDTVLSPNQCGGPLVDVEGNIVGINIARAGRVATYAIPSSVVRERVDQLLLEAKASK